MDPLSAGLASLLAPSLPYLLEAGEAASKRLAGQVGNELGNLIVKLWDRLWPKLSQRRASREAVKAARDRPNDQRAQDYLAKEIERLLREPKIRAQIDDLYGRVLNITGDRNTVQYGKYNVNMHDVQSSHIGDYYG